MKTTRPGLARVVLDIRCCCSRVPRPPLPTFRPADVVQVNTDGVLAEPAADVLRARWWIAPPKGADALDARDRVLTAVTRQLTAHAIDLPFPTQPILFYDHTVEWDGDRVREREGWPAGQANAPASRKVADVSARISGPAASRMDGE